MKKKGFLFVILAALTVLVISAVGVGAYFTDTAVSSDNIFQAGTLDLKLSNDGVTYTDNVTATWSTSPNWAPGDIFRHTLKLHNAGNIDARIILFDFDITGSPEMADKVCMTYWGDKDVGVNYLYVFDPYGGADGCLSLTDLANLSSGWHIQNSPYPVLPAGAYNFMEFEFLFDTTAGNDCQGDMVDMTLTLTAEQVK